MFLKMYKDKVFAWDYAVVEIILTVASAAKDVSGYK